METSEDRLFDAANWRAIGFVIQERLTEIPDEIIVSEFVEEKNRFIEQGWERYLL
jgi:hypothetical protein